MRVLTLLATASLTAALAGADAVAAKPTAAEQAQATVVTVSLSEYGIKLSKSVIPTGAVTFRVVNNGKAKHAFRAAGRATPMLRPGQAARLTVEFTKPGTVTLVCTVSGHARRGMTRKLTVAAPAAQHTVVSVSMFEMGFKLTRTDVPRGTVEFRVLNDGKLPHDFRISGKGTPMLKAGERATVTVSFPTAGAFSFVCTVEGHAGAGMVGKLTVR